MPYILRELREDIDGNAKTPGELNYILSSCIDEYLKGNMSYTTINEVIGVLECAKLEVYRRIAAPYEDKKKEENGDVYSI